MTTHNDHTTPATGDPMEARLRAMLSERAGDVEATPALYEDVRSRARRGTFVRRAVGAVAVAAAVTGGALVLPNLLPEAQIAPIDEQPETSAPTEIPTELPGSGGAPVIADVGVEVAVATTDGVFFRDREQLSESATIRSLGGYGVMQARVLTLPIVTEGDDDTVRVALVDTSPDADGVNDAIEAAPNGDGVVMSPDGQAAAWIEGSQLHIWPVGSGAEGVRVLPLEGADTPADLVIEQWFAYADAPLLLASQPGGGMWTVPMDESNVFDTAPVGDTFPSGSIADAADAALLQDGTTVSVHVASGDEPATVQLGDGDAFPLREPYASSTELELEAGAGGGLTLLDRSGDGDAMVLRFSGDRDGQPTGVDFFPIGTGLVGAVTMGVEDQPDTRADEQDQTSAGAQDEFVTDAPLLGTDGVTLIEFSVDTGETRHDLFPPAESEASLGRIAVRPGSTSGDVTFAVESFSEGETSVRFGTLRDGIAAPVGDAIVVDGVLNGLVWSPDGREVVWTTSGLERSSGSDDPTRVVTIAYSARVDDQLAVTRSDSGEVPGPVVDWIWTDQVDGRFQGVLVVGTPDGGAAITEVQRFTNGQLSVLDSIETLYSHDMHLREVTSEGPSVGLRLVEGQLRLSWSADGDGGGDLPLPESLADSDGAQVRMKVSGGQVLLLRGREAWQVLVPDDGRTLTLPSATDWDILD